MGLRYAAATVAALVALSFVSPANGADNSNSSSIAHPNSNSHTNHSDPSPGELVPKRPNRNHSNDYDSRDTGTDTGTGLLGVVVLFASPLLWTLDALGGVVIKSWDITRFFSACTFGNDATVREIIYPDSDGHQVCPANLFNSQGLMLAAEGGHLEIVKMLVSMFLKGKCPPNARNCDALRLAAVNGHDDIVLFLLSSSCPEPRCRVDPNSNVLIHAVHAGKINVVGALLRTNAYPLPHADLSIRNFGLVLDAVRLEDSTMAEYLVDVVRRRYPNHAYDVVGRARRIAPFYGRKRHSMVTFFDNTFNELKREGKGNGRDHEYEYTWWEGFFTINP